MQTNNITIHESRKTKLKWKNVPKFKDNYRWPIVQIQEHEGSLHFKFSGGSIYSPNIYMVIENYRQHTALEITNALDDVGFNTRHSYDAVLKFYHERGLELGFTRKIYGCSDRKGEYNKLLV